ncbi:hypothetical protein [Haloarchaeobius sp. HME9146]|uniref:hypothetical protein n=1 Tax=Haloarchaeobius sp. HME9146 TaxID=2978732 RepID=UPI0021BEC8A0|nr:hypothetical protein [Haloarchaeobius sp. HME9146]MCT9095676.1 hypothetical protein [Haloarchaeobius sp. HME9146]
MIPTVRDDSVSEVPNVPTRFDESASDHIVSMLLDALEDRRRMDDPHVLAVGIQRDSSEHPQDDVAQETVVKLQSQDVAVMGLSADAAVDSLGEQPGSPTDCYDAIVVFTPLNDIDGLSVEDLLSEEVSDQLLVDVTGTVDPALVVEQGAITVTYRGL